MMPRSEEFLLDERNRSEAAHDAAREKWERFTSLPAIKAGRLYTADGNLLHRYGPRVVDGLELLARLIHPEAFPGKGHP